MNVKRVYLSLQLAREKAISLDSPLWVDLVFSVGLELMQDGVFAAS
jgi:hypothetical protein